MAIRRCPYCRAIIEEGLEYCSNCGTQLLFPEDEFIEEDIPGEKIIDVDEDVKAAPKKKKVKPRGPKTKAAEDRSEEEKIEPRDDEEEKIETERAAEEEEARVEEEERLAREEAGEEEDFFAEEEPEEELLSEEEEDLVIKEPVEVQREDLVPEEAEPVSAAEGESKDLPSVEERPASAESLEEEKPEAEKEEADVSELGEGWTVEEVEAETEEPPEQPKKAFTTGDLEKIVDPAEREKVEIERFLESIRRDRGLKERSEPQEEGTAVDGEKPDTVPPPQPEELEPGEEIPAEPTPPSEEIPEKPPTVEDKRDTGREAAAKIPETGELPPWASKMREEAQPDFPLTEEVQKPVEEAPKTAELDTEEQLQTPETGMGIPETVDQQSLPFGAEAASERKAVRARAPSRSSSWLRPRIFDILFIALLWAVGIFIAARLVDVSLVRLVSVTTLTVVAFYLVLIVTYFFLFLFFLGETLGDRLFTHDD